MKSFLFEHLIDFRAAGRATWQPRAHLVIRSLALIVMVGAIGFARAGDELPSQDQALTQALENHPDIVAAKAKVALVEAELYGKRMEVSRQVIGLYGSLKMLDAQIAAAKASLGQSKAEIERLKKAVGVDPAEPEKLSAAVQTAEAKLVQATGQREQTEKELRLLIGATPGMKEAKSSSAAAISAQQAPQGPIVGTWKAAAEKPIKIDVADMALDNVLEFLSDKTRIKFSMQRRALEEAGEAADMPITMSTNEVPLAAALQAFQDTYPGLRFVLRDYGVLLTTKESAHERGYMLIVPGDEAGSGGKGGDGFF